jgi:hypothetical protein
LVPLPFPFLAFSFVEKLPQYPFLPLQTRFTALRRRPGKLCRPSDPRKHRETTTGEDEFEGKRAKWEERGAKTVGNFETRARRPNGASFAVSRSIEEEES